jgi:hypothetical protein
MLDISSASACTIYFDSPIFAQFLIGKKLVVEKIAKKL